MPSIKIAFGNETRRAAIEESISFNQFVILAQKLFSLPSDQALLVRYVDEDEDVITISSDVELHEALKSTEVVKFHISVPRKPAPQYCPTGGRCAPHCAPHCAPQQFESNVHPAFCDSCQDQIRGIRYKCLSCADYDLCQSCMETNIAAEPSFHDHPFLTLETPRESYQHQWQNLRESPLVSLFEQFFGVNHDHAEQPKSQAPQRENKHPASPVAQTKAPSSPAPKAKAEQPPQPKQEQNAPAIKQELPKEEPAKALTPFEQNLKQLEEMGFADRQRNIQALAKNRGDLARAIRDLLEAN